MVARPFGDEPHRAEGRPVIVLTPGLSRNATGRAMVFVEALMGLAPVILAGRSFGPIWRPMAGRADVTIVDLGASVTAAGTRLRGLARGAAAIVAIKPLGSSYLLARAVAGGIPIVLDIDDPESALATAEPRTFIRSSLTLDGPITVLAATLLRDRADARTVASSVLASRYGGLVVPHVRARRHTEDPAVRDRAMARAELGLPASERCVVFLGTPRRHKGIETFVEAAARLPVMAFVVGGDAPVGRATANVRWIAPMPYGRALRWLAAADIVVVPQNDGRIGRWQTPAKLTDALSMGRAVVASDLPPIREVVGDAGRLVPPRDPEALAYHIESLLDDDAARRDLEARARARFVQSYSAEAIRPTMMRLLRSIGLAPDPTLA